MIGLLCTLKKGSMYASVYGCLDALCLHHSWTFSSWKSSRTIDPVSYRIAHGQGLIIPVLSTGVRTITWVRRDNKPRIRSSPQGRNALHCGNLEFVLEYPIPPSISICYQDDLWVAQSVSPRLSHQNDVSETSKGRGIFFYTH